MNLTPNDAKHREDSDVPNQCRNITRLPLEGQLTCHGPNLSLVVLSQSCVHRILFLND